MSLYDVLTLILWGLIAFNLVCAVRNWRLARQISALRDLQLDITTTAWICRAWPARLLAAERDATLAAGSPPAPRR